MYPDDEKAHRPRAPSDGSPRRRTSTDSRVSIGEGVYHMGKKANEFISTLYWIFNDVLIDRGAVCLMRGCARFPCIFASVQLIILITFVIIGLATMPMDIDADFESFLSTDVRSSLIKDAYDAANAARPKPGVAQRRLNETTVDPASLTYRVKTCSLYYEVQGAYSDVLSSKVLEEIVRIESGLRSSARWQELCSHTLEVHRHLCSMGVSFPSYVLPLLVKTADSLVPTHVRMDVTGDDPIPLRNALWSARKFQLESVFLPEDLLETFGGDDYPTSSTRLRSVLQFKIPVGGSEYLSKAEVDSKWDSLIKDVVIPYFDDFGSGDDLRVSYEGTDISDLILKETLHNDMLLAIASAAFVMLYLIFHTRSFALTFAAISIALLAVPFAYIVTSILTDTRRVNFTSFLAVFLLVGFGADIIFVYTDFWHESGAISKDPSERLIWTYRRAGRASFATTGVTCVSFFANLASVIRALRQFGFFMGLCVMFAWIFITCVYVPILVFDERALYYCRICSKGAGRRRQHCMGSLTQHLRKWRAFYLFVGLALMGSVAPAVLLFDLNTGLPDLYPETHNVIVAEGNLERFVDISMTVMATLDFTAPTQLDVCGETTNITDSGSCGMRWCEVSHTIQSIPTGSCVCYEGDIKPASACTWDQQATVFHMIVSRSPLDPLSWGRTPAVQTKMQNNGLVYSHGPIASNEPPIVMNEWESGKKVAEHSVLYKTVGNRQSNSASCGWEEYCFCETGVCDMDASLQKTAEFPVGLASRRLEEPSLQASTNVESRRLIVTPKTVANSKQIIIRVVFGIWANTNLLILGERKAEDMWAYLDTFDLSSIWAQRNILEFCRSVLADPELLIVRKFCWVEEFRDWLVAQDLKYPVSPVEAFHSRALEFIASRGAHLGNPQKGYEKVWVVDGRLIALQADFALNVEKEGDSAKIEDIKNKWEARISRYNDNEAKEEARGAVLVSKEFVKIDADNQLVVSAAITFGVLLVLAFLGMVIFTCSILLSLVVVLASVVIICALASFIICVLRWEIGLLEVIATIYFIGYAVTYSLHIAHKYAYSEGLQEHATSSGSTPSPRGPSKNSDKRFLRTRYAMMSIGSAALGSSITTAGASFFLIFSTLGVFTKLGTMCLTVTVLSIIVALFPLPALLLSCGPINPGRGCCCRRSRSDHRGSARGIQNSPRATDLPRHFSL